jgi:hypothetical protein
MVDEVSAAALWTFIKDWKPEIRIHAGDNWDFRAMRKAASDEERQYSLEDDWTSGIDFMRRFFDGGKTNHFLRGNHDERIYDYAFKTDGLTRDYALSGIQRLESTVARSKATMLPYNSRLGVLTIGNLKVVHGYHAGANSAVMHSRVYGNVLFGHVHDISVASIPGLESREARSLGCMCKLDMAYASRNTGSLKWANSWTYGLLFEDGTYQLHQTRKLNNKFYAATDFKNY